MTPTRTGYNEYVSREELAAHLGPINQSLSDIRTDVKAPAPSPPGRGSGSAPSPSG
jgi:hypothetical protein